MHAAVHPRRQFLTILPLHDTMQIGTLFCDKMEGGFSHSLREGVKRMRITLHIGAFTVTIVVKRRNRHSAK